VHAILVAELADNAAWEERGVLARDLGQEDMARRHLEATLREARLTAHWAVWKRGLAEGLSSVTLCKSKS
jgi:hypothetical protein